MTDKQMEEKKKQLFELLSSLEWTCDTSHPDREYIEKEFESVWSFVTKLVEEVEREKNVEIIKRLKEYQLGLGNYIEEYGLNRIEAIKVNEFGIKDN